MKKNKSLAFVIASFFLFSVLVVSAQLSSVPLEDFLSEDVTQINIEVTQETSEVDFYLNTEGHEWDEIENFSFSYNLSDGTQVDFEWDGTLLLSELLNGIEGDIEITEDSRVPYVNSLSIKNVPRLITDFVLVNSDEYNFDAQDINDNVTIINNFLEENPLPEPAPAYSRFVKDGSNYVVSTHEGYGDIPIEYMDNIRDIINESVHYINIANVFEEALPFLEKEYDEELADYQEEYDLIKGFDLNYTISAIDTDSIELHDGAYDVTVTFERGNESVEKVVHLTLEGIRNVEVVTVSNIYSPAVPEVSEFIDSLAGLQNDTSLIVEVFDSSPHATPSSIERMFKFIDITVDKDTSARLYFSLNQDDVNSPNRVSLYVWESNHWTKLNTDLIDDSGSIYKFEAEIPHFSSFMIAETEVVATDDDDDDEKTSGGGGFLPQPEEQAPIDSEEPIDLEGDENERFLSGITGAVIGFLGSGTGIVLVTVLAGVAVGMSAIRIRKKRLARTKAVSSE